MSIKYKTLKNGYKMPELGIGTWKMGAEENTQRDIQAIKYAISLGVQHIDTAEIYDNGNAEVIVGKAIEGYHRDTLYIASKCRGDAKNFDNIKASCLKSLEHIGIKYFDLYYLHWRDPKQDLEKQMQWMNALVDEGLIKHIGVSNFSIEDLKFAQSVSKCPIKVNQVHYSIIYKNPTTLETLRFCQENDILLCAWRPMEEGRIGIFQIHENIKKLNTKYGADIYQIALNWLLGQKNVITIFKSSNPEHIQANITACRWNLSKQEIEGLKL